MPNTQHTQFQPNSLPRRLQPPEVVTTVRGVRQDNPTPPRARIASPQPAPLKKKMRPPPFDMDTEMTHPGRPKKRQTRHTTLHLKLRVRADLERKAKAEGLSISTTGSTIIEWFFTQSLYTQHTATIDTAIDTSIGRHMRTYSDRNAGLQARNLQKTELVFNLVTNILGRMPGMDENSMRKILSDASDAANGSITRTTPQQKRVVDAEKQEFIKRGVNASG